MTEQFSTKFLVGLILIVGFLVYVNSLPNGFVWDDEEQIVNNLVIRDWKNFPLIFTSSTFYAGGAGLSGGFYRPLVTLSYFFNYHLWGLNPVGYRLFQIAFHLSNLILIFFILTKILSTSGMKKKRSNEISGLATILFAVHPANVESVVYLASLGEILYTFFILLAFLFFLKSRFKKNLSNHFYLGLIFSFLGLLSKESAVVIFPLFALYLFIFLKPKLKNWLTYGLGSGIVIGLYLFLRFFVAKIPAVSTHFSPISGASFFQRLMTVPYEIFSYFKIIFFPKDLAISRHFVISSLSDIRFWGSSIFLLLSLLLISLLIWKRKSKIPAFSALWFFGCLSPALNIFPLDMTMAERWLYFPMIGILVFISFFVFQLKEKLPQIGQRILIICLVFILLALSIRTAIRNINWKDGLALYGRDVQYSKNSFDLENNYGVELFRVGKIEEASHHFRRSIELQPKWTYPHNNLGAVYERHGDYEKAKEEYEKAIELSDYYLAYENLGNLLVKMDKIDEAKTFLENSILKFPKNSNLKFNLALIYYKESDWQKSSQLLWAILLDEPENLKAQQFLWAIQQRVKYEL